MTPAADLLAALAVDDARALVAARAARMALAADVTDADDVAALDAAVRGALRELYTDACAAERATSETYARGCHRHAAHAWDHLAEAWRDAMRVLGVSRHGERSVADEVAAGLERSTL